jgi:hypothetical protein
LLLSSYSWSLEFLKEGDVKEGDGHKYINNSRGKATSAARVRMRGPTRLLWEYRQKRGLQGIA